MEKRKRCSQEDLLPLLHDEYLIPILLRLPIISLLRFKPVCKSWRALIQSSLFIDLHTSFNNSSSCSNKFGSFILQASLDKFSIKPLNISSEHALIMLSSGFGSAFRTGSGGCWWSTGDDDQPDEYDDDKMFKVDNLGGSSLVFKLDSLGCPSLYKFCGVYVYPDIVGSYNGLVCLYDKYDHEKQVSLWNPATRQFRILPESIHVRRDDCPLRLLAFGFDVKTKDYKVVLLAGFKPKYFRPTECLCRVQVYSLSTNSWRLCEGIFSLPGDPFGYPTHALYLNGSCFFLAKFFHTKQQPCIPKNDRFVISFDLNKEWIIVTPIQLPDHHQDQELHLSCIGDKMALFAVCYYEPPPPEICGYEDHTIWVLNEQVSSSVNKESWTKLHSFRIEHKRPCERNLPRGISNDGEFALLETRYSNGLGKKKKKMKLYDLATKEVKKKFLSCSSVKSRAIAYTPSLVSIIGGNGEEEQQQQHPIG